MARLAASCWEIPSLPHQCTRSVDHPDQPHSHVPEASDSASLYNREMGHMSRFYTSGIRAALDYV